MERVAFDTETWMATPQEPTPPLVSAAFAWDGGSSELLHHTDPALEGLVEELLRHHELTLFNAPYDMAIVGNMWPHMIPLIFQALKEGRVIETRTRERMLDIAFGLGTKRKYNLGTVAGRRVGREVDKSDPWRKKFKELHNIPIRRWPKDAIYYALNDAEATFEVDRAQEQVRDEVLDEDGVDLLVDQDNQARADWSLALQSQFGIVVRQQAVKALDRELKREFDQIKRRLQREKLVREDGSRDTKLASALAGQEGATVRTTKGFSLAEGVLLDLQLPEGHALLAYQRYGSIMGLRSRVITALSVPLIRTRYEVLVDTGRTSSSDPNIQNFPREGGYRECLGCEEGNVLIVSDYNGAEMVTHAQDCLDLFPGKPCKLAEILNAGEDAHGYLGADVMKIPYEQFMKRYEAKDPVVKKVRQGAKPGSFGFPVGMGINRFIQYSKQDYGVEVTESEAKRLRQLWLRRYPENRRYLEYHRRLFAKRGDKVIIKQLWSGRVRGGCSYTEACNTRFQGRAADGAKKAMWRIAWNQWMEPESALFGTRQIMFGHDENVLESPEEQAEAARAELDEVMTEEFEVVCPDMKVRTTSFITDRYRK